MESWRFERKPLVRPNCKNRSPAFRKPNAVHILQKKKTKFPRIYAYYSLWPSFPLYNDFVHNNFHF